MLRSIGFVLPGRLTHRIGFVLPNCLIYIWEISRTGWRSIISILYLFASIGGWYFLAAVDHKHLHIAFATDQFESQLLHQDPLPKGEHINP